MRVYVHGNCQGPAIATLIKGRMPGWDVASYEVFNTKIIGQIGRYYHYVETADIIISQPVHDGYRQRDDLSLNWLRSTARPNAQFVIFPSMFFDGQLVGCRSIAIPAYGMPYHDTLLAHLVVAGVTVPDIINVLLDTHLYTDEFIEREIDLSVSEMRRREGQDGIDVPISPFLEEYGRSTQIFHVINHPCRPALAYVANQILAFLGYSPGVPAVGEDLIRFPHIPVPPSVERFISTHGRQIPEWQVEDGQTYHLPDERLSRPDYIRRAVHHLGNYTKAELEIYLQETHTRSFLHRLAIAVPGLPGIDRWADAGSRSAA